MAAVASRASGASSAADAATVGAGQGFSWVPPGLSKIKVEEYMVSVERDSLITSRARARCHSLCRVNCRIMLCLAQIATVRRIVRSKLCYRQVASGGGGLVFIVRMCDASAATPRPFDRLLQASSYGRRASYLRGVCQLAQRARTRYWFRERVFARSNGTRRAAAAAALFFSASARRSPWLRVRALPRASRHLALARS